jgi:sigma-B regulation protein RsbU (phosphoserine phosphatase)
METVDWDMEDAGDNAPAHESFGENQVGSITLTLEPVHTGSPLNWVAEQFHSRPELFALPVEKDGGVVGLVTRARILERASKFLENLSSRPLDLDLTPHRSIDARESVDKVVSLLFADDAHPLTELFLVYLDGSYYGVTDLRRLVSRSAKLREQDLAKAQEVQQGALARSKLPETRWQRSKLVRMAYGVGGDFYQEIGFADGTCFLGCFDVSGKGISGSLVTSALGGFFSAVRSETGPTPTPEVFSQRLNEFLREILPLGTFVTAVLFVLAAQPGAAGTVKILNFGYGPIYYYQRKDNKVAGKGLRPNLPPLGLDTLELGEGAVFPLPFEPGTKVYVFSDGMSDLMNPSGQRYGEETLREFLSKIYKHDAAGFLAQLTQEIEAWQGEAPQADDITALTIQA